jgi:hypothetical protein
MTGNELHSNIAKGDIAGGDIHKNTYVQAKDKSPLRNVVEKLEADCLHDPDFNKYINALTHYTNSVHPDSQRDLQTKLTEANRQDELHEAEELKEKFAKLLVKSSLSEQAQNAYVHVLSKIKLDYDHKVKPLLKEGAGLVAVEASVHQIIMGIYEDLTGTVLEHNVREIKGMLYFLTGNCHIEWKY